MTLLYEAVDSKKLDVRLIERNVARGVVTAQEVDQNAKSLPDDGDNAEYVSIQSLMDDQIAESESNSSGNTHH